MVTALIVGTCMALVTYVALDEWSRRQRVREGRAAVSTADASTRAERWSGSKALLDGAGWLAGVGVVAALALVLRSVPLALIASIGLMFVGYRRARFGTRSTAAMVDAQLPDAMFAMASATSAGLTLFGAIERTSRDSPPPLGPLLADVIARARSSNVDVDESLAQLAARVDSVALRGLLTALSIQRITGGNLARLLRDSAESLREVRQLTLEARALSSQARYSAKIIGLMPVGLFALFYVFFPSFVAPLTSSLIGLVILAYAALSTAFGFYVIRRIALRIERI